MSTNEPATIWIVERVRDEQYGQSRHAVTWQKSRSEAEAMVTRLQTEFDQACASVHPRYESVERVLTSKAPKNAVKTTP